MNYMNFTNYFFFFNLYTSRLDSDRCVEKKQHIKGDMKSSNLKMVSFKTQTIFYFSVCFSILNFVL